MTKYRTCVYIDGFNLYYAAVRDRPELNVRYPSLRTLCANKLDSFPDQEHILAEIHYFTARVHNTTGDPTKRRRQKNYNRALKNHEDVNMHYGRFSRHEDCFGNKTLEEKQSDVNLATYFVHGAYPYPDTTQGYDYAVIISEDTDFCGAIEFVLETFTEKTVDVWTIPEITRELDDMRPLYPNQLLHHRITDNELKALPQIANRDHAGII